MNDRELLELAAKAAGYGEVWYLNESSTTPYIGPKYRIGQPVEYKIFDPLTDDGDALRLAVKLSMDICFGANYVIVRGSVQMPTVNNSDDPYAATRRAIVCAAAEIGRAMP